MTAVVLVLTGAAVLYPIARKVLYPTGDSSADATAAVGVEASGSPAASTKAKKPRKRAAKTSGPPPDQDEDARSAALPPLAEGVKCWHRQDKVQVTVIKVYYDDPPTPYYTIRMPNGTERATVRARLESNEERQAAEEARSGSK